jgi:hypothetical protein
VIYTEDYESIFVIDITRIQAPFLEAYRKVHLIENEGIFRCSKLENIDRAYCYTDYIIIDTS